MKMTHQKQSRLTNISMDFFMLLMFVVYGFVCVCVRVKLKMSYMHSASMERCMKKIKNDCYFIFLYLKWEATLQ